MNYKGEPIIFDGGGGDLTDLNAKTQNIKLPDTKPLTTHIAGSISLEGGSIGPVTYSPTIYDKDNTIAFNDRSHPLGANVMFDTTIMNASNKPADYVYADIALPPFGYVKNNIGSGRCLAQLRGPTQVQVASNTEKTLEVESTITSDDIETTSAFDGFRLKQAGTYLFTVSISASQTTLNAYGFTFFYFRDALTNEQFGRSAVRPTSTIAHYHNFTAIVNVDKPQIVHLCVFSERDATVGSSNVALLPTVITGTRLGKDN
jgi:hypothetical protein